VWKFYCVSNIWRHGLELQFNYVNRYDSHFVAIFTWGKMFRFDAMLSITSSEFKTKAVWPGNFLVIGRLITWKKCDILLQVPLLGL
jgi:hypothetical protein